jgi:hypothetical protein
MIVVPPLLTVPLGTVSDLVALDDALKRMTGTGTGTGTEMVIGIGTGTGTGIGIGIEIETGRGGSEAGRPRKGGVSLRKGGGMTEPGHLPPRSVMKAKRTTIGP